LSFIFLFSSFWFSFAKERLTYDKALGLAKQYIENSLSDESWKDNNPYINWEWKYFYTDDEKKPSYIEFKVSCKEEINCWFILVNSDWNDVAVPIASTSWVWPAELLTLQNETKVNTKNKENKTNKKSNNKLYYFWPLEQYSIDDENDEVLSINPEDNIDSIIENDKTLTKQDKDKQRNKHKTNLKDRIKNNKLEAKNYKKSDEFKKKKEEIKDQILQIPKEEFSFKSLDMAFADLPERTTWVTYTSPWASDIFVPWSSTSDCTSRVPCYQQFQTIYSNLTCSSWCSPTAVAILFWYYDKNWFSNLVSWTAPTSEIMNTTSKWLVNSVAAKMWTYCKYIQKSWTYQWATNGTNIINTKQYAIDKWYKNTTSSGLSSSNISTLFSGIKTEINAGRPTLVSMKYIFNNETIRHTAVVYWYKSTPSNSNIVLMNMWWWKYKVDWWTTYTYSSINQNLWSIYYVWSNNKVAYAITKFTIKQ